MIRTDTEAPAPPTKACPYCAETIRAEAVRCRFCGSDLSEEARRRSDRTLALLSLASLLVGIAGGLSEVLTLFDVDAYVSLRGESSSETPGTGFGPPPQIDVVTDAERVAAILAAFAAGALGAVGVALARRRFRVGIALLVAGGALGLAVTLAVGVNVLLLGLSILLLAAAASLVLLRRPWRSPSAVGSG